MFMPDAIVEVLSAHLERAGFTKDDTGELVFTDEGGRALRYSNWHRRVWLPAVAAAGCAGAGFHDLRRLNATTLVVEGIDVKTAQTRLGHAEPTTTLAIYASAPASIDRAAADIRRPLLRPTDEKASCQRKKPHTHKKASKKPQNP